MPVRLQSNLYLLQAKRNIIFEVSEPRYSLKKIGATNKPLSKKEMIGNHFQIKIDGASDTASQFEEHDRILNFYGYQRFGSARPVSHLIGKSLLQKNYLNTIQILLSFTSEYDKPENTELRKMMSDKSKYHEALKIIPNGMDLEKTVLKEMIESDNPVRAIRALPLQIRRFFCTCISVIYFQQNTKRIF